MPITIFYDSTQSDGGTPPWASHKEFKKLANNATFTATEVEDDADSTDWETPCAQNTVNGLVLIDGPYSSYDVVVSVLGTANENPTITGTGRVTGGLAWQVTDHTHSAFARGTLSAIAPPAGTHLTPFGNSYSMRIPNGVKTRVCGCNTAGGIQIAPNPGSFYASMKVDVIMAWSVQPIVAWIDVGGGTGIQVPIGIAGIPGMITLGGDLSYWNMLGRNFGTFVGGLMNAFGEQKATEDFQDPGLKRQIGEAAGVLEHPDVKQKIEDVGASIGKPVRQR